MITSRKVGYFALAAVAAMACSQGSLPSDVSAPSSQAATAGAPVVRAQAVNCTLTQGYWKNHEESWPVEALVLGGEAYTKAQALAILRTPVRGDATYALIHQLIAATLNSANGADTSSVAGALADANAWLQANPLGSKPKGAARDQGVALATVLDDYNNGRTGPGHCDDANPTATPTGTPTGTPTSTPTITPTNTPTGG
jgi:hypothetical protein